MFHTKKNILLITLGAIVFILIANFSLALYLQGRQLKQHTPIPASQIRVEEETSGDFFAYKGVSEKDALSILKEKTSVEQNNSGLVVSINGRKADDKKREYWAFYVNGKMAEVGPAEYITKDEDKIEWKIEKY